MKLSTFTSFDIVFFVQPSVEVTLSTSSRSEAMHSGCSPRARSGNERDCEVVCSETALITIILVISMGTVRSASLASSRCQVMRSFYRNIRTATTTSVMLLTGLSFTSISRRSCTSTPRNDVASLMLFVSFDNHGPTILPGYQYGPRSRGPNRQDETHGCNSGGNAFIANPSVKMLVTALIQKAIYRGSRPGPIVSD